MQDEPEIILEPEIVLSITKDAQAQGDLVVGEPTVLQTLAIYLRDKISRTVWWDHGYLRIGNQFAVEESAGKLTLYYRPGPASPSQIVSIQQSDCPGWDRRLEEDLVAVILHGRLMIRPRPFQT